MTRARAAARPARAASASESDADTFRALYAELRKLARRQLGAAPRTTLCTTALVHEAWLKLGAHRQRVPDLALAARAMRHVLIDHVRRRRAAKRGGGARAMTLDTRALIEEGEDAIDLLALEQGLQALQEIDPRLVGVVECHFFAGMEFAEIGEVLQLSERTVQRDWRRARAFLHAHLAESSA